MHQMRRTTPRPLKIVKGGCPARLKFEKMLRLKAANLLAPFFPFPAPIPEEDFKRRILAYDEDKYNNDRPGWPVWELPLAEYTHGFVAVGALVIAHMKSRTDGEGLRVLDIGIGSGKQWLDFCNFHQITIQKGELNLYGIALTGKYFKPELGNRLSVCRAKEAHVHLPNESFDLIISDAGMHCEEVLGMAAIQKLLKVGGEAILRFLIDKKEVNITRLKMLAWFPSFKVIATEPPAKFHLQKMW